MKNKELYSLYKETSIVKMINIARLKWLGYRARTEDNVPCRKIFFFQSEDSRNKGRLRLRWIDSALKDLKTVEVHVWWTKARDNELCSEIIRRPRHRRGCSAKEEESKVSNSYLTSRSWS